MPRPLESVQQEIHDWADRYWSGEYWPPHANLARLVEEVGELARGINQIHGPKRVKDSEALTDIEVEFGDVLFALTCLANSLDIDLQNGFDAALAKYRERDEEPGAE